MRAARLIEGRSDLLIQQVEIREPEGTEVLIEVRGAGVCRSDIHTCDGMFDHVTSRPVTLGHEVVGDVVALGQGAHGLDLGTSVVVTVGWGCGRCSWCHSGAEHLCPIGREAGSTADGGFAEYMLVPHSRYLIPIGGIPLTEATPLGCAALSSYAGVRRTLESLSAGGSLVIIGAGGLGLYAIHYARRLSDATVIAVDTRPTAIEDALSAGAHDAVLADDAEGLPTDALQGMGARAVIDLVGTSGSMSLAASAVGIRGIVVLMGLAGGSIPWSFTTHAPEAQLTTVAAGSIAELTEVVRLAQTSRPPIRISPYSLDAVNVAIADLRAGNVRGRAVIRPEEDS